MRTEDKPIFEIKKPENQLLFKDENQQIELWIKRLDNIYPNSLGNKIYKLKYNLLAAKKNRQNIILTFGGAFSNHIAAVALAAKNENLKSVGIIRGEELGVNFQQTLLQNSTLSKAVKNGMKLEFISRQLYREKHTLAFQENLLQKYPNSYILPEGGTNALAIKGCEEILTTEDKNFDYICCPVGTGGTLSGIINAAFSTQKIIGFSALNTDLSKEISKNVNSKNWKLFKEKEFGGFAKINQELVSFINKFTEEYHLVLDPIYTGKMFYAVVKKMKKGYFKENSRILAIHTGGLQGIEGMNQRLKKKKLPIIKDNF